MSSPLLDNVNPIRLRQTVAWTEQRSKAAIVLASGGSKQEAADAAGVNRSTIYEWLGYPEFEAEVDRLSLMIHISSRAERLRIAMRVAKARVGDDDSIPQTDKDLLDWLKFAQSETDGAKIDLSKLAEMLSGESGGGETTPASSLAAGAIEIEASRQLPESSEIAEVQGAQGVTGDDSEALNAS